MQKIWENIENIIFSLIFVLWTMRYFRQLRKTKKIWYLRLAFLRKCGFSCSDIHRTFKEYSYIQYSWNIIWEYSPKFNRKLFLNIPGIYHLNVSRIFHKHIFARWVITLTDEIYPFSEMQSTLLMLNAAPSNAAFWMQFIVTGTPVVLKCFSRLSLIVSRAPTKLGIIVALKFHSFCSWNLKSLHCLIFSNSFVLVLWSSDTTRSLI